MMTFPVLEGIRQHWPAVREPDYMVMFIDILWLCLHQLEIDPSHKSHNAPDQYPTMHHFVTEMCTHVHISVTKWCIVWYLSNALWDLWNGSILQHTEGRVVEIFPYGIDNCVYPVINTIAAGWDERSQGINSHCKVKSKNYISSLVICYWLDQNMTMTKIYWQDNKNNQSKRKSLSGLITTVRDDVSCV